MDLDEFDEFEMEDMSRFPQRMGSSSFPSNPLHIDDDPFSSQSFGNVNVPDFDSIMGSQLAPPQGAPVLNQFGGGDDNAMLSPADNKKTIILTCCLFCVVLLLVILIIGLCIAILIKAININYDVNNLKFKVDVPVNPPPPSLPSQLG